ncbi:hypothetical protein Scep_003184 [Stephania cephalantha]|uniref:Dirigent protein n=1 Tax=Stephania cephalantha TaxID=152367 RepID=A0AAP0PVL2_9MAGN
MASNDLSKFSFFFLTFFLNIFVNAAKIKENFSKEKLTHLHFYFHDIVTATNPTVVQVAAAPNSTGQVTPFGSVMIVDDPLTEMPDPKSKLLGKAQGLYSSISQSETTFLMALNFVFTEGKYNGSTFSIFGKNSIGSKVREIPVVGGTGMFRFARGYALVKTYALAVNALNAIVENIAMGMASNDISKFSIFFVTIVFFSNIFVNAAKPNNRNLSFFEEKLTSIHFYFHDVKAALNPTVVQVAQAPNSTRPVMPFGSVMITDDPLTETPDPTSKLLGRAQGLYSSISQSETTFLMALNFVFTDGKYNGSTISIFGKNSIGSKVREMPVVGGTGMFRFARGYALAKTYALDVTTLNAIVEYVVHVLIMV